MFAANLEFTSWTNFQTLFERHRPRHIELQQDVNINKMASCVGVRVPVVRAVRVPDGRKRLNGFGTRGSTPPRRVSGFGGAGQVVCSAQGAASVVPPGGKVLVVGSTGGVGQLVVAKLLDAGRDHDGFFHR